MLDISTILLEKRGLPEYYRRVRAELKHLVQAKNDVGSLTIKKEIDWHRRFRKLLIAYPGLYEIAESFWSDRIEIIKQASICDKEPICICIQKNDLIRIKENIKHHRSIGITQFVILDNASTDGSVEWLTNQSDVTVLRTKQPYTTNRREAWINRIISYYGTSRWYLIVDSDELLTYWDCETTDIRRLIEWCEGEHIDRMRAMMIDMYAEPSYYENGDRRRFVDQCNCFDVGTYHFDFNRQLDLVCGGPRERVFGQAPWLTKYPLINPGRNGIECKSHFPFPLRGNKSTQCYLALRHYKFLPGDIEQYRKRVQEGSFYNGSSQYKQYISVIEENDKLNFICQNTKRYSNSRSLYAINELTKWNHND